MSYKITAFHRGSNATLVLFLVLCRARGEKALLELVEAVQSAKGSGRKEEGVWSDHSQRWFTLMPSTRPFIFKDHKQLADIVSILNFRLLAWQSSSDSGRAIVCSDAAAEAARYGFTAVDRPEGFLVLAMASFGHQIVEVRTPPEDTKTLEEKKVGVKGSGRKTTDEAEHFTWRDEIKVPCGKLVPSDHKDSVLEYNENAVYDPKMTSIRFLVSVKYEEQNAEVEDVEPA
ncbi:unnamed protein product [Linum tenue]|uniref:Poly [ADP-ribose] polymerase n=1 Tax=Linum tenue TaxID=586396 RepID=A0AAV0IL31_9ROSI|nr:unnamed protein product [Linum tenue]